MLQEYLKCRCADLDSCRDAGGASAEMIGNKCSFNWSVPISPISQRKHIKIHATAVATTHPAATSAMTAQCQRRRWRNAMTPNPVTSAGGKQKIPSTARHGKRYGLSFEDSLNAPITKTTANTAQKYRTPRKARCLPVKHSAVRTTSVFAVAFPSMESSRSFAFYTFCPFMPKIIFIAMPDFLVLWCSWEAFGLAGFKFPSSRRRGARQRETRGAPSARLKS